MLDGRASRVQPAAAHISEGVILARDLKHAEMELAERLMPSLNAGGRSGGIFNKLSVPLPQRSVASADTDPLETNVASPFVKSTYNCQAFLVLDVQDFL